MILGATFVGLGASSVWWLTRREAPAPAVPAELPTASGHDLPAPGAGAVGGTSAAKADRGARNRGSGNMPTLPELDDMDKGLEKAAPTPQAPLFEIESRDEAWAPVSERELAKRLAAIAVDQVQVESAICKTSTCQVVFAAAEPKSLGKVIGKLETPEGVYGWADHLLLGAPVTASSGTTMQVTLLFDR